jgi:hypothetical protein
MAEKEPETEVEDLELEEASESDPVVYLIKSVVRGRHNRIERKKQPGRQRFVQRLAGGRFVVRRARPVRVTEAVLKLHLEDIKAAVASHAVVVTTLTGQLVDLDTFDVEPAKAEKPMPNPPLDSAKNDKNEGIGYKVPATPEGTDELPDLLKKSMDSSAEDLEKEKLQLSEAKSEKTKHKKTKSKKPHVLSEEEVEGLEQDLEEMSKPAETRVLSDEEVEELEKDLKDLEEKGGE